MSQPTKQCLSLVTIQSSDEVATFTEHVQKIQDTEYDVHVATGQ